MKHRLILSLCDFSGNWSQPYIEAGYQVQRIDLQHGEDVRLLRKIGNTKVHGILAAPPCTAFAGSGARYWKKKDQSGETLAALSIVDACMRIIAVHQPVWWALENPKGRLAYYLGEPAFTFNPCDYGDAYTKRTLLWGRFTPPLPLFSGGHHNPIEPVRAKAGHH